MKHIAIGILAATLLAGMPQTTTAQDNRWITLDKAEYTMTYPNEWRLDESGDNGAIFTLYAPFTDEEDTYMEMISLTMQPQNGLNMTLDKWVKSTTADIPFFYKNSSIFTNKVEKKSGMDCAVLHYTGSINDFGLMIYQYHWLINEQLFTLSFTSQPESTERFMPLAKQMMDSFRFKK